MSAQEDLAELRLNLRRPCREIKFMVERLIWDSLRGGGR